MSGPNPRINNAAGTSGRQHGALQRDERCGAQVVAWLAGALGVEHALIDGVAARPTCQRRRFSGCGHKQPAVGQQLAAKVARQLVRGANVVGLWPAVEHLALHVVPSAQRRWNKKAHRLLRVQDLLARGPRQGLEEAALALADVLRQRESDAQQSGRVHARCRATASDRSQSTPSRAGSGTRP